MASAGLQEDLRDLKKSTETCVESQRHICVIGSTTQVLTSSKNLEYLFETDPDIVEWYVRVFQRASFEVAKSGRAPFRKFMTENATWALDFHSELRKFLGQLPLGDHQKAIAFSGYDLLRADACDEINIEHCAVAATRGVNRAHARQYWDQVVERFELEEPFKAQLPKELIEKYQDQF